MSFWNRLRTGSGIPPRTVHIPAPAAPSAVQMTRPYAMERTGDDSAEIVMYGTVERERPTDWWTGDPLDGQYIILSEFLEDLKQVEDVAHLTVRIHSVGGDAYDSMTIHNRLKALNADITVIVDGVAMSGGAMIMCAADSVQVFPGSLIMIHKCLGLSYGNADELRRKIESYDAMDRAQAAIFQGKTGIGMDELLAMMSAETYMTGQEAIDKGFADQMVEGCSDVEIAASADRRTLYVAGRQVWASARKGGIPPIIPTVKSEGATLVTTNTQQPAAAGAIEGGTTMAKTLKELRAENPELANQLMAEAQAAISASSAATPPAASTSTPPAQPAVPSMPDAVSAERQRIQEIDALAALYDAETIQAAKYGDQACTAQEMAYRAAQKAVAQGRNYLQSMEEDALASGAQAVGAAPGAAPTDEKNMTPDQRMASARAEVKTLLGKKKED